MREHIGPHIKAVLFDHDDTLVGTIEAKWAQHRVIAKEHYGKDLTDEELRKHWGKPFTTMLGLLYGTDDLVTAMDRVIATHKDFPKLLWQDTIKTLQQLRISGKKIGIVTSSTALSFNYDLETMDIAPNTFDYVQTEEDTEYHKPDPRVFDPAIHWLATQTIRPAEVVYVGDGLHDMQAALGAGFEFIGVTTGLVTQAEFSEAGAASITTLGELVNR